MPRTCGIVFVYLGLGICGRRSVLKLQDEQHAEQFALRFKDKELAETPGEHAGV